MNRFKTYSDISNLYTDLGASICLDYCPDCEKAWTEGEQQEAVRDVCPHCGTSNSDFDLLNVRALMDFVGISWSVEYFWYARDPDLFIVIKLNTNRKELS